MLQIFGLPWWQFVVCFAIGLVIFYLRRLLDETVGKSFQKKIGELNEKTMPHLDPEYHEQLTRESATSKDDAI